MKPKIYHGFELKKERVCDITECPLHGHLPVWGEGPTHARIMLIGEAPGHEEESYGVPFCGKSGQELSMYLSRFARIRRDQCYITNLVKCRPPENRDPHVAEIEYCFDAHLCKEINNAKPKFVGLIGRVATRRFMNNEPSMEKVHGVPQNGYWGGNYGFVGIPLYHPAFGLHSTRQMKEISEDFTMLGRVVRGEVVPRGNSTMGRDYRCV